MTRTFAHHLAGLHRNTGGIKLMARFSLFRQRRALAGLEAHMLKDIGLTKHQALVESERPIWDAPCNWKA